MTKPIARDPICRRRSADLQLFPKRPICHIDDRRSAVRSRMMIANLTALRARVHDPCDRNTRYAPARLLRSL